MKYRMYRSRQFCLYNLRERREFTMGLFKWSDLKCNLCLAQFSAMKIKFNGVFFVISIREFDSRVTLTVWLEFLIKGLALKSFLISLICHINPFDNFKLCISVPSDALARSLYGPAPLSTKCFEERWWRRQWWEYSFPTSALGSSPGVDVICWSCLVLVLSLAPRGLI